MNDKKYEIVKISHHGSNSSSSRELLEVISPDIGLISCGKDNPYGHPHPDVLERFEKRGTRVYRTDLSGAITVVIDGKNSSQAVIFPV
jgi:competence protein ComEC